MANGLPYITQMVIVLTETSQSGPPIYGAKGSFCFLKYIDSVNGGSSVLLDQPDTGGGLTVLSVPIRLQLNNGANSITFGDGQSSALFSTSSFLIETQN